MFTGEQGFGIRKNGYIYIVRLKQMSILILKGPILC